jgi:hypothetical protein
MADETSPSPPVHLMAIDANGSIIVAQYTIEYDGLKPTVLMEHIENDELGVPMNFVTAELAWTLVTKDGAKRLTID